MRYMTVEMSNSEEEQLICIVDSRIILTEKV